jgi:hypothetical protein
MKKESQQSDISLSLTNGEESGFTLSRFATGIGQPRAFECQLLPMAKGVNSSKMELIDAVASLEPGLTEFGHAHDQSSQAVIHRWLIPFVFDDRWKQELVSPRARVCAYPPGSTFLGIISSNF